MLTFDANDYTVHFTDGQGRTTAPMPLLDLSTECGGGIVVIGGRAFAVEVTDLGWVEASTDSEVPAAEDRRVIAALGKTQKLRVIPIDPAGNRSPHREFVVNVDGGTICQLCGEKPGGPIHDPARREHPFFRSAMDPVDSLCEFCGNPEDARIHTPPTGLHRLMSHARTGAAVCTCGFIPASPAAMDAHKREVAGELVLKSEFTRAERNHTFETGEYVDSCKVCAMTPEAPIHRMTLEVDPNSDFARAAGGAVTPAAPAASEPLTIAPGADVSRDGIGEFIYPDGSPRPERRDPEDVTPSDPDIELNEPCEACGQPDHKHPYDGCDFGAAVLTETGEAKRNPDKVDREG